MGCGWSARKFQVPPPAGFSRPGREPSALVQLGAGAMTEPNQPRYQTLRCNDGLVATSQHAWPTLQFDLARRRRLARATVAGRVLLQVFIPAAGGVQRLWEPLLRRMAGLGRAPREPDPAR